MFFTSLNIKLWWSTLNTKRECFTYVNIFSSENAHISRKKFYLKYTLCMYIKIRLIFALLPHPTSAKKKRTTSWKLSIRINIDLVYRFIIIRYKTDFLRSIWPFSRDFFRSWGQGGLRRSGSGLSSLGIISVPNCFVPWLFLPIHKPKVHYNQSVQASNNVK